MDSAGRFMTGWQRHFGAALAACALGLPGAQPVFPQQGSDSPQGSFTLKANAEPWALTLRETTGANVSVEASVGKVEQVWPVCIAADQGTQAQFTITGGVAYTPVTISGARAQRGFTLYTRNDDGTLAKVDQSPEVGRDWWQADFDAASKSWDITYTLSLDTAGDARTAQSFVWRMDEPAQ